MKHLVRMMRMMGMGGGIAFAMLAGPLLAQEWPVRPVRVIVNVAPGGVADIVARLLAPALGESLRQPFVVENRAGGDGLIGIEVVARADPDGYTICMSPGSSIVITPHLAARKDLDPLEVLSPIAPSVKSTQYLVVHPSSPAKSLEEFMALAKKSTRMNYGSAGTGTGLHISAELFRREVGFEAAHIPYKGAGPALNDLLGAQFDFMFDPGSGVGAIKGGKLRLLAVTGTQRHPDYPDTPTFDERGIRSVDGGTYFGFYATKGTPVAIVQRLNAEIARAVQLPESRKRFDTMGAQIGVMSAAEFGTYVRVESERYAKLIREFGIRKD
ncbi:MAG: Bug family tripartite tricarboxylate transporter substrate binding protein [Burkholderiales bacterium]